MGNVVILQMRPGEIVPLLKDPSLRKLAWFGPQGLLARLEPSLELDMMARYGAGTEDRDVDLLLRLVDVGGANEERHVTAAGYRIVTKAGPTWVVTGPTARIPKLLESDRIAYIEGASKENTMPRSADDPTPLPKTPTKASASRRLIIKFRPDTIACTPAGIAQFSSTTRVSLEFVRTMSGGACVVKQIADDADTLSHGQKTMKEHPAVEYLEPDTVMKALE